MLETYKNLRQTHAMGFTVSSDGEPEFRCARRIRRGYLEVRPDGLNYWLPLHRLAAATFYGPDALMLQIRHRDHNKLNNARANLCLGTLAQNGRDNKTNPAVTGQTKN